MIVARLLLFMLLLSSLGYYFVDGFVSQGFGLRRVQSKQLPHTQTLLLPKDTVIRSVDRFSTQKLMMARRMRGSQPLSSSPTITYFLIGINVIMFMLTSRDPWLKQRWMKIDRSIAYGDTYRLLSAIFVHANLPHVLSNSMSLYNIGPTVPLTLFFIVDYFYTKCNVVV